MFYCEPCRKRNHWPRGFIISRGPCEICHEVRDCHDVPSKWLPYSQESQESQPLDLTKVSDNDLAFELARRERLKKAAPNRLSVMDFTKLVKVVEGCIGYAVEQQHWNEDNVHYIFEEAMKAVYGSDIFERWYNKQGWVK